MLSLAVLALLVSINYWIFPRWFAISYVDWYLDMSQHTGLISAHPLEYTGSYLQLVGLPVYVFGTHLRSDNASSKSRSLFDTLLSIILILTLTAIMVIWLLVVVPIQYAVYLIIGAPGRFISKSRNLPIARLRDKRLDVKEISIQEEVPEGWWHASLADKPVAITGLFSSLFFFVIKEFVI